MKKICKEPDKNADIGEKLRYMRLKKGLTLKELAKKIYITDATLSRWERNLRRPYIDDIVLLAKALDFSIDELTGIKNDNKRIS